MKVCVDFIQLQDQANLIVPEAEAFDNGFAIDNNISIDLTTPHAKANLHLIKKISQKHTIRSGRDDEEIEDITLSIEMYDAQSALNTLAKHHGLLTEKTEITGKDGEAIQVKFVDYRAGLNGTSEA